MSRLDRLKEATTFYGYDRVGAVISAIEPSYNGNPGRYGSFADALEREVRENVTTVPVTGTEVLTPGRNILAVLERQLDANPGLQSRLIAVIRNHPREAAGMLDGFHNGSITLADGITRLERLDSGPAVSRAAASPPPAAPRAPARPPAQPRSGTTTFSDELNTFGRNANVTDDEEAFIRMRYREVLASGGGMTEAELRGLRADMTRLQARSGNQLTEAELARVQAAGVPPPPPPPSADAGGQPQPGAAAPPPEPPRYTPPATLTNETYAELMANLGSKVAILMPAGMGEGNDSQAFMQRLQNPEFRDRFIQLYNSDPQYRQAIQTLYNDADALAQRRERSNGREIDPNSEIGRRIGVLQGQFRGVMTNPDDLLNVNRVLELQEGVSGLRNFAGSMNGMLDQAPPWMRAMLQPILEIFDIFRPAFSRGGLAEGMGYMQNAFGAMGINLAGNGGGNMLGGLFGGLLGGTGGTGGAPPPPAPALASADAGGTGGPRNPTLAGPQAGPTGQPIVPGVPV